MQGTVNQTLTIRGFNFNDYFNTLYLRTRLAGYGTIGIEADFE